MKDYWITDHPDLLPEVKDIINDFLSSIKLAKANKTVYNYKKILERFFLDNTKPLDSLTHDDVLDWVHIRYAHIKKGTRNTILGRLSKFFSFCVEEGYMKRNLIKRYWYERPDVCPPKFLSEIELAQVRIAAEKLSLRDRCIIEFYISSGCRLSELNSLDICDIDLKNRCVKVRGKGDKERDVFFSQTCAILLEKYLATCDENQSALFISYKGINKGTRLGISGIEYMVANLGKMAGLKKKLTPHIFRHTFATHLLTRGAELTDIQSFLGHSEPNTTRIYARVLPEKLVLMYHKCMG